MSSNYSNWLQSLDARHDIENLLGMAKNPKLSRRRRRAALEQARELSMMFFGDKTLGSSDESAEEHINSTTDSDNSSVSSVSSVSSDSNDTKQSLKGRFYTDTPEGWQAYLCLLESRKKEKRRILKRQKREAKRALIAIERRRRYEEEQRSRFLDATVENPLVHSLRMNEHPKHQSFKAFKGVPPPKESKILQKIGPGFFWKPETSCLMDEHPKHQLVKGVPLPKGPNAWNDILGKRLNTSKNFFFDSNADDERDD